MAIVNFPQNLGALTTIVDGTSALVYESYEAFSTAVKAGKIIQFPNGITAVGTTGSSAVVGSEVSYASSAVAMEVTTTSTGSVVLKAIGGVIKASLPALLCTVLVATGVTILDKGYKYSINKALAKLPPDKVDEFYQKWTESHPITYGIYGVLDSDTNKTYLTTKDINDAKNILVDMGVYATGEITYGQINVQSNNLYQVDSVIPQSSFDAESYNFIKTRMEKQTIFKAWADNGFVLTSGNIIAKSKEVGIIGDNFINPSKYDAVFIGISEGSGFAIVVMTILRNFVGCDVTSTSNISTNFPYSDGNCRTSFPYSNLSRIIEREILFLRGNASSMDVSRCEYRQEILQTNTSGQLLGGITDSENLKYFYTNPFISNIGSASSGDFTLDPDATYPNANDSVTVTYPQWGNQVNTISGFKPDAETVTEIETIPIEIPLPDAETATDSQNDAQEGTAHDENVQENVKDATEEAIDDGLDVPNEPIPKPSGETPIVIPPSSSPIGMNKIYVPTESQLQNFNDFIWSTNFVDVITQLLQDPMEAIISLHRIYVSPVINGSTNIVLGKVTTNISSNYCDNQYITIDCGTIAVTEYFGDARDYNGFTDVQIYLPFIGFCKLNTNDVINSYINVVYRVDILTGNCVANINITKDYLTQTLYSFNGNCAEQVPITGANYSSIVTSSLATIGSVVATVASKGMLAPTIIGSTANLGANIGHTIQHGGSLGGNFGALANKKPYLIITRTVTNSADNYNNFYGFPANKTVKLKNCNGYNKIKDVHVTISTSNIERNLIETKLKDGVII